MTDPVDWTLARQTAFQVVPAGPRLSREEVFQAVAELRALARASVLPVAEVTGLPAPASQAAHVVDRRGWIASNISALQVGLGPLLAGEPGSSLLGPVGDLPAVRRAGAAALGVQLGSALAWLSTKVLGQYEIFTAPVRQGQPAGEPRLLLNAPTIVSVERRLGVPSRDFRLWVCLHEQTHRLQFATAPWLAEEIRTLLADFIAATDEGLAGVLQRVSRLQRGPSGAPSGSAPPLSVLERLQSDEQRAVFDRMTALMSVLEGHADVVMDEVGPAVVPSVELIRERFNARRENPVGLDAIIRKALGLDLKAQQYRDGAAFVRTVIAEVGMSGFNRVWSGPAALPTRAEIADPGAWVRRMADAA